MLLYNNFICSLNSSVVKSFFIMFAISQFEKCQVLDLRQLYEWNFRMIVNFDNEYYTNGLYD